MANFVAIEYDDMFKADEVREGGGQGFSQLPHEGG